MTRRCRWVAGDRLLSLAAPARPAAAHPQPACCRAPPPPAARPQRHAQGQEDSNKSHRRFSRLPAARHASPHWLLHVHVPDDPAATPTRHARHGGSSRRQLAGQPACFPCCARRPQESRQHSVHPQASHLPAVCPSVACGETQASAPQQEPPLCPPPPRYTPGTAADKAAVSHACSLGAAPSGVYGRHCAGGVRLTCHP